MKIINSVITVQLTGIDQANLSNAYTILTEFLPNAVETIIAN